MVEYFNGLRPASDEAFLVFGINGRCRFSLRFPEKKEVLMFSASVSHLWPCHKPFDWNSNSVGRFF